LKKGSVPTSLGWRWYRDEQIVNEYEVTLSPGKYVYLQRFDRSERGIFGKLGSGKYKVVILIGGEPAMSGEFTIEP